MGKFKKEYDYAPVDDEKAHLVKSTNMAMKQYMLDQGIEKYDDNYYNDDSLRKLRSLNTTQAIDSVMANKELRDKRNESQTYNYRDSNPYGEQVFPSISILRNAEGGNKSTRPLKMMQMMRVGAAFGNSDAQIRDTIAMQYSIDAPATIKWDFTGD